MRASYSSVLRKHVESQSARQVVVFEHPDNLRVEIFVSGLNRLGALITATPRQLQALFPDDHRAYIGAPNAINLAHLLSVPLGVEEVMYWFAGRLSPDLKELRIAQHEAHRDYLIEGHDDTGRCFKATTVEASGPASTVLDADAVRLRELEITRCDNEELLFRAEFVYERLPSADCSVNVPSEMTIWLPSQSVRGTLTAERITCNTDLSMKRDPLFHPRLPDGIEIHPLDDSLDRLPDFEGAAAQSGIPSRVE